VSGGCVEVEVIAEAADVLTEDRPKLLEFGVAEDVAWRAGLPCGGAIRAAAA
jgi:xanthine dehydrogenase accessory factor